MLIARRKYNRPADARKRCAAGSASPVPLRRLGVWRSLVARSVRVGEAPSSNLGTPIALHAWSRGLATAPGLLPILACVLRAVVFDVDFTLARPGPDLGARRATASSAAGYGLDLDPRGTRRRARRRSRRSSAIPSSTTTRRSGCSSPSGSSSAWVGRGDTYARRGRDGEPLGAVRALRALRRRAAGARRCCGERGLLIGLLSNSSRNLDEFVAHHRLAADAVLTSHAHGKTKPHETIFRAMLELLDVAAGRGGDGRRHDRGRRRGRAGGRDAGGAARPRRAATRSSRGGSTTCASSRRRSASCPNRRTFPGNGAARPRGACLRATTGAGVPRPRRSRSAAPGASGRCSPGGRGRSRRPARR